MVKVSLTSLTYLMLTERQVEAIGKSGSGSGSARGCGARGKC